MENIDEMYCPAGKIHCTKLIWNAESSKAMPECDAHNIRVDIALYEVCHWPSRQIRIITNYDFFYKTMMEKIQDPGYSNTYGTKVDYHRIAMESLQEAKFEKKELKREEGKNAAD